MKRLKQFLKSVYGSIEKRRDSYVEMGLALASCEHFESVVQLSENPVYRRKFSSIYETLEEAEYKTEDLLKASEAMFSKTCEELSGYEVYSGDSTFDQRNEAKTLPDRVMKRLSNQALVYGYESYWTTRLSEQATSWAGVMQVDRMKPDETVTQMAAKHLLAIDQVNTKPKLFVFDAGHSIDILKAKQPSKHSEVILRLKSHQVFYHDPDPQAYKGRGRRPIHGKRFKLSDKQNQPDEQITIAFKNKRLEMV